MGFIRTAYRNGIDTVIIGALAVPYWVVWASLGILEGVFFVASIIVTVAYGLTPALPLVALFVLPLLVGLIVGTYWLIQMFRRAWEDIRAVNRV